MLLIVSLALLTLYGFSIAALLAPTSTLCERLSLAFPFGMGLTTLTLWGMLAIKLPVSGASLIFFQTLLAAGSIYPAVKTGSLNREIGEAIPSGEKTKIRIYFAFFLLLAGIGLTFNFLFPIVEPDGVGYKIYGEIATQEQNLTVFRDFIHIFQEEGRTLGFQLLSGYSALFGFKFPKIVQSFYYISLLALFYISSRKLLGVRAAAPLALLLATAPMLWWQSFLYLNNLSAGLYFFCGTIYWFLSIHYDDPRHLSIASLAFMLAAWTRYELIVFFFIPLTLVYHWSLKNGHVKAPSFLLLFPLLFSGLWAVYSAIYFPEMKISRVYCLIFLFLLCSFPIFLLIHKGKIQAKTFLAAIVSAIALSLILGLTFDVAREKISHLYHVWIAKLFWNFLNQSVWGFGILLTPLILVFYKSFTRAQKYLLCNLLALFLLANLTLAILIKDSSLLHRPLAEKIFFFITSPAKIVTRSSSREFTILFPSLLFLLGTAALSPASSSKTERLLSQALIGRPALNGLNFLIFGNIILIAALFISPRIAFLKNHFGESLESITVTPGSGDNKNIYWPTHKIAYAISRLTPQNATIIFPDPKNKIPSENEPYNSFGVFQSYDVLYPRKLLWGEQTQVDFRGGDVYQVTNDIWLNNRCKNRPEGKSLGYKDWFLCPADRSGD